MSRAPWKAIDLLIVAVIVAAALGVGGRILGVIADILLGVL